MSEFSIEYGKPEGRSDVAILVLHGEMDTTVIDQVEAIVNPLLENEQVKIIAFEISDLRYMNSRSVGLLMNFYGILKERGRSIVLIGLQDGVKDTLSLVGVTQLVQTFDTLDQFTQSLS